MRAASSVLTLTIFSTESPSPSLSSLVVAFLASSHPFNNSFTAKEPFKRLRH
ncbi:u3 small nucleolar RNA-associated protein 10 [Moniliophthora roreri]|nr:u3 small nucleolar RNA-associated protein 10 [Moniliophthora roreri]